MAKDQEASVALFRRFLAERFDEFKGRLADLIRVLATNDQADKLRAANAALESAKNLRQALSQGDQPSWLLPFERSLTAYVANNANATVGQALITTFGNSYADVQRHEWSFEAMAESSFDFDGLYREFEDSSRIPELFDKLVNLLEQILKSGAVDSVRVLRQLELIIASLRKNRKGSYFSVVMTWKFGGYYLKNVLWGIVKEIPVVRVPVIALRETMEEIDNEMTNLHSGMNAAIDERLEAHFPLLEYHPFSTPQPLALTDESSIIDAEIESSDEPTASPHVTLRT